MYNKTKKVAPGKKNEQQVKGFYRVSAKKGRCVIVSELALRGVSHIANLYVCQLRAPDLQEAKRIKDIVHRVSFIVSSN